jgi:hypothetical protein
MALSARSLLPSSVLPYLRPQLATLKRLACEITSAWDAWGAGNDSGSAELLVSAGPEFPVSVTQKLNGKE